MESLCGLMLNAVIVGAIWSKAQRGSLRALSIIFSERAVIKSINGLSHFIFRVGESRRLQICEAHVRLYCVKHGVGEDGHHAHQRRGHEAEESARQPGAFTSFDCCLSTPFRSV